DTLSANQDALGGRMYFATSAEVLFQIPGVPQDFGLRGAVFADAGSLWGVNKTAAALPGLAGDTLAPRASVGMGLAWDSPLGALRADYAFPIVKQPYDKTQAFSFGLSPFWPWPAAIRPGSFSAPARAAHFQPSLNDARGRRNGGSAPRCAQRPRSSRHRRWQRQAWERVSGMSSAMNGA